MPTASGSLYLLTQAGRDLRPVVRAIGNWGAKWAFGDPDPAELDPDLVVQWISRHLAREQLPARRVVVQFAVTGPPVRRYWLVIQPEDVSVCMHDPGFGVDAVFRSDARTLYRSTRASLPCPTRSDPAAWSSTARPRIAPAGAHLVRLVRLRPRGPGRRGRAGARSGAAGPGLTAGSMLWLERNTLSGS